MACRKPEQSADVTAPQVCTCMHACLPTCVSIRIYVHMWTSEHMHVRSDVHSCWMLQAYWLIVIHAAVEGLEIAQGEIFCIRFQVWVSDVSSVGHDWRFLLVHSLFTSSVPCSPLILNAERSCPVNRQWIFWVTCACKTSGCLDMNVYVICFDTFVLIWCVSFFVLLFKLLVTAHIIFNCWYVFAHYLPVGCQRYLVTETSQLIHSNLRSIHEVYRKISLWRPPWEWGTWS